MAKLIVTADDFGLSKGVNEGILIAFHRGIVRNTALMVNFPEVEESVASLQNAKGLDVGIHLNLTCGPPVLKPGQVPSLVGKEGLFSGLIPFFSRVALGRINWSEVRDEWKAQIERGLKLKCRFTSVNSHQHIHMLPQLARIAVALAKEYGIPWVRLSRYAATNLLASPSLKSWVLSSFGMVVSRILKNGRVSHNDYLIDIPRLPVEKSLERLCRRIRQCPGGTYELVCHPGYVDSMLESRDHYTVERLADLEVMTAPQVRALFQKEAIELTTYRALTAAGIAVGVNEMKEKR